MADKKKWIFIQWTPTWKLNDNLTLSSVFYHYRYREMLQKNYRSFWLIEERNHLCVSDLRSSLSSILSATGRTLDWKVKMTDWNNESDRLIPRYGVEVSQNVSARLQSSDEACCFPIPIFCVELERREFETTLIHKSARLICKRIYFYQSLLICEKIQQLCVSHLWERRIVYGKEHYFWAFSKAP